MNGYGNGGIALDERRVKRSKGSFAAKIASVALGVSVMVGALVVPSAQADIRTDPRDPYWHGVTNPDCQNFGAINGLGSTVVASASVSSTGYWRATLYRTTRSDGQGIVKWSTTSTWLPHGSGVVNLPAGTRGYYWIWYEFWWPGIFVGNQTHGMWSPFSCLI